MAAVWFLVVPIGIIALLFILKAVRQLGNTVGTLAQSMVELKEVGVGLNQLRDELAAQRAASDDVPPQ
ncbi:MAG: hypothetical protein QOG43_3079 [Actinomycetota bacterium]|jgi:hypothetical protein|nr:hypothetical protein [Actinomycetota bacterium]